MNIIQRTFAIFLSILMLVQNIVYAGPLDSDSDSTESWSTSTSSEPSKPALPSIATERNTPTAFPQEGDVPKAHYRTHRPIATTSFMARFKRDRTVSTSSKVIGKREGVVDYKTPVARSSSVEHFISKGSVKFPVVTSTPEPSAPGPATPGPSAPRPSAPGPSAPEPSTLGPATHGPSAPGFAIPGPSTLGSSALVSAIPGPATLKPSARGPSNPGPATLEPSTPGPATPHGQYVSQRKTKLGTKRRLFFKSRLQLHLSHLSPFSSEERSRIKVEPVSKRKVDHSKVPARDDMPNTPRTPRVASPRAVEGTSLSSGSSDTSRDPSLERPRIGALGDQAETSGANPSSSSTELQPAPPTALFRTVDSSEEIDDIDSSSSFEDEGNLVPGTRLELPAAVDIENWPIGLDFTNEGVNLRAYLSDYIVYRGEAKSKIAENERVFQSMQELRDNLIGYRRCVVMGIPISFDKQVSVSEYLLMEYSKMLEHRNWLKFIYYDHENDEIKAEERRVEIILRIKTPIILPKFEPEEEEERIISSMPLSSSNIEGLKEAYLAMYTGVFWRDSSFRKPPWCCYFWEKLSYPTSQIGRLLSFAYTASLFNYFIRGARIIDGSLPLDNLGFLSFSSGMAFLILLASFTLEPRIDLDLRKWLSSLYNLNASKNVSLFGKIIHNLFWLPGFSLLQSLPPVVSWLLIHRHVQDAFSILTALSLGIPAFLRCSASVAGRLEKPGLGHFLFVNNLFLRFFRNKVSRQL